MDHMLAADVVEAEIAAHKNILPYKARSVVAELGGEESVVRFEQIDEADIAYPVITKCRHLACAMGAVSRVQALRRLD